MTAWTREAIEALGPVTDVPTTASIVDLNEWSVYEAIRRGGWHWTRVLRLGRTIKIPTHDLIALLYPAAPTPDVPAPFRDAPSPQVNGTESQAVCGCATGPRLIRSADAAG